MTHDPNDSVKLLTFFRILEGDLNPNTIGGSWKALVDQKPVKGWHHEVIFVHKDGSYDYQSHLTYWFEDFCSLRPKSIRSILQSDKITEVLLVSACAELKINPEQVSPVGLYVNNCDPAIYHLRLHERSPTEDFSEAKARFHFYDSLLHKEYNALKIKLHKIAVNPNKPTEKHIRKLTIGIVSYLDQVWERVGESDLWHLGPFHKYDTIDIYKLVCQYLDGILLYLKSHYKDYFDFTRSAPLCAREKVLFESREDIAYLKGCFSGPQIDHRIANLGGKFINELYNHEIDVSFQHLEYASLVIKKVAKVLKKYNPAEIRDHLIVDILKKFGFNTNHFAQYLISQITETLEQQHDINAKLHYLYQEEKQYKQSRASARVQYTSGLPPVSIPVKQWLKEEIAHLHRMQYENSVSEENVEKLHFNLSVKQVTLFFRLLSETNVLAVGSVSELNRTLHHNIESKQSGKISPNSIRKAYYEPDKASIEKTRNLLQAMMRKLDTYS